jgi:hypothetical protein
MLYYFGQLISVKCSYSLTNQFVSAICNDLKIYSVVAYCQRGSTGNPLWSLRCCSRKDTDGMIAYP